MCDLFSKWSFLVTRKSAQSLCLCLQELISQYGPPGPPFVSEEVTQFLQCNHINHMTSSPHFLWSNGFIEHQVRTLKTALSITADSRKTIDDVLLDLCSAFIGPNMPSPWEILNNRTFQWPSKPSYPVDMERVWNFLLSRKQSQKMHFDCSHGIHELTQLGSSQEVLFRSLAADEYIPGTIVNQSTEPHSYIIKVLGKQN